MEWKNNLHTLDFHLENQDKAQVIKATHVLNHLSGPSVTIGDTLISRGPQLKLAKDKAMITGRSGGCWDEEFCLFSLCYGLNLRPFNSQSDVKILTPYVMDLGGGVF